MATNVLGAVMSQCLTDPLPGPGRAGDTRQFRRFPFGAGVSVSFRHVREIRPLDLRAVGCGRRHELQRPGPAPCIGATGRRMPMAMSAMQVRQSRDVHLPVSCIDACRRNCGGDRSLEGKDGIALDPPVFTRRVGVARRRPNERLHRPGQCPLQPHLLHGQTPSTAKGWGISNEGLDLRGVADDKPGLWRAMPAIDV